MDRIYDDFDDGTPRIMNNPLKITETNEKRIIDFYLINVIEDVNNYIDFLRAVDSCRPQDEIIVHINCYGGELDVGMNIYDSLIGSDANVTISVEGVCASCASMIMLAGNQWNVTPHSYVMIHEWSGCEHGKWHEIKAQFKYDETIVENQFRKIYKNFLTDEEIELCLNGKDFYFDSEETVKRLNNYQKEDLEREEMMQKIGQKYSAMAQKEVDDYLKKSKKKKIK